METYILHWDCPECCEDSSSSSSSSSSGSQTRLLSAKRKTEKDVFQFELYLVDVVVSISYGGVYSYPAIYNNQISNTNDLSETLYKKYKKDYDERLVEKGSISNINKVIRFSNYQDYIDYWNDAVEKGNAWTL